VSTSPSSSPPITQVFSSYGGIIERGSREYTLDDFYTIQLDKLDRYICLRPISFIVPDNAESSSEDDSDGDDDDSSDDDSSDGRDDAEEEVGSEFEVKSRKGKGKKGRKQETESDEDEANVDKREHEGAGVSVLRFMSSVNTDHLYLGSSHPGILIHDCLG